MLIMDNKPMHDPLPNYILYITFLILLGTCVSSTTIVLGEIIENASDNSALNTIIDSYPVTITKPGSYIVNLSGPVNDTFLIIYSSDVSINGMGNNLTGKREIGKHGIVVGGQDKRLHNITVKNLTLEQFDIGMYASSISDMVISDIQYGSNLQAGVRLEGSDTILIQDSEIKNNWNEISGGSGVSIIDCAGVSIESSRVTGNGRTGKGRSGGLFITNSSLLIVKDSIISANPGSGVIFESSSSDTSIINSEVSYNQGDGIILSNGINNAINNCQLENNKGTGLQIINSKNPEITDNRIGASTIGISISDGSDMILRGNRIVGNRIGFDVSASDIRYLIHQIDSTNFINGRPLLYLLSQKNRTIGPSINPAQIILVNCSDIKISDLVLSKNGAGIYIAGSDTISVQNTALLENGFGIFTGFETRNSKFSKIQAERNLVAGYYFTDSHDLFLDGLHVQDGPSGIYMKNCSGVEMQSISVNKISGVISRMPSGITLNVCSDISLSNSVITDCSYAGLVSSTNSLLVNRSKLSGNGVSGCIILSGPAMIKNSIFSDNTESGIISLTNNTRIISNTITDNGKRGVGLIRSGENYIVDNYLQNVKNYEMSGVNLNNTWNASETFYPDEYVPGGNYWGDLTQSGFSDTCITDDEGFCLEPYILDQDNIDYRPLSGEVTAKSTVKTGDLNKNGRLDLHDVTLYMNKVSKGEVDDLHDFSGDGRVNLNDVVALFKIITEE